ncbi:GNAT family N-acetyltransferase [Dactylosporangium sp. AC04546]|uniref:GNAT family N-acetyltransferase n=1 Tax=Dactylosporangium sp. AC04546 TaxID=2862460 RepID=UPI001EDFC71D|nr:GNAT family N-acetyltransferase [Dactylosporangium sp. AC04546]WVK84587.1 GNAT family N-acetyltransferase [Dactylosporangium sp. AC04546]
MRVREWDPATAPKDEIEAVLRALNEIVAVDVPEDPPWRITRFREYLAVTMPGERRTSWLAESDGGEILGHASLLALEEIGVLELSVVPAARRSQVGTALLAAVARRAAEEGFESVGVEVIGGTPAVKFFETHGFECAFIEMRNLLDLGGVDWLRLGEMAAGIGAGYRVEYHPGGPPESHYAAYAAAKEAARAAVVEDLELRPSSYDAERLRASLGTLHARGLKPYIVLAVHEATDEIAGLTEVVVPAQRPTRADQYDTIEVPIHRGYGISRAIKARMLFELRAAEPHLLDVQTWNALENEPLLQVNAELGFKPDREWREYEADVVDLLRRLKS